MKGYRKAPKNQEETLKDVNQLIKDFHATTTSVSKKRALNKAVRAWLKKHGTLTTKKLSGFKSFVIENTKIE